MYWVYCGLIRASLHWHNFHTLGKIYGYSLFNRDYHELKVQLRIIRASSSFRNRDADHTHYSTPKIEEKYDASKGENALGHRFCHWIWNALVLNHDSGEPESKTYNIVTDHMPVGFGNWPCNERYYGLEWPLGCFPYETDEWWWK